MTNTILILHGWAKDMSGSRYVELSKALSKRGFTVFAPDLPGFGKEKLIKKTMTVSDYVEFVKQFMDKKDIKKAIVIGHSFGGRIGVKLAVDYPSYVKKLVLSGSPLIRQEISLKKRIAVFIGMIGKRVFSILSSNIQRKAAKILYFFIGEWDYYKAGNLQETFKSIVSEDLSKLLSKVKAPTLVIWGEQDAFVPVHIGREISQKIPDSQLVVVPRATHRFPYENPLLFVVSIENFL